MRTGPPLVLLHGAGDDHRMWQPQRDGLGRRIRLILPDLPGYGRSPGPFSLDTAVDALRALAADGPVHVCGLSAGAMVGLRWAARHPEDVASLALSAVQLRPPRWVMTPHTAVMRLIPAKSFDGVTKQQLLRTMGELSRADLRPDLGRVRARTLVLCGAKDRLNQAASRAAADGIAGAELRIVPGAGHLWNQELPELFDRTLTDWVGQA
ncbi:alpha/beta fold hydrolase [Actinoplanes sp. NPDC048796]|uniref:alpha/beta fold hydrolase n=1 Tax=Actinoplanes sp. NPDC048796 TaxID=3155640 RepID=UPI00340166DD